MPPQAQNLELARGFANAPLDFAKASFAELYAGRSPNRQPPIRSHHDFQLSLLAAAIAGDPGCRIEAARSGIRLSPRRAGFPV